MQNNYKNDLKLQNVYTIYTTNKQNKNKTYTTTHTGTKTYKTFLKQKNTNAQKPLKPTQCQQHTKTNKNPKQKNTTH